MRTLRWTGGLLALAITSSAYADIYTSTQMCWAASGNPDTDFNACTGGSSITQVTANPDGTSPNQVFSATALSVATPDTWHVAMTLSVQNYRRDMYLWTESENGASVPTTVAATVSTTDSVTVTGGTGVYSLHYIFSVDGSLASTDPSLLSASFGASLYIPNGTSAGAASFYGISAGQDVPTTFTLSYDDLPFGGPITPTLYIGAYGLVQPIYAADAADLGAQTITGDASVQFGNTVHLTSVLITDAAGNAIPGLSLESASGYTYPLDPLNTAPVPEPASLVMLLGGLGLLGLRQRRKAR